jgi:16S rRNA (cytosine1402-N4)-methyltransferase
MSKHVPVLLNEVLEVLSPKPGDVAIDATLGAGGHASELLKAVGPKGMLLGIDADKQAAQNFQNSVKAKNAKVAVGNFAEFAQIAKGEGIEKADVILFDFGLSSDQLDNPERGFSFQKDGPLDMRLNTDEQELTAGFIVNKFSEQELTEILRNFGEEPNAKNRQGNCKDTQRRTFPNNGPAV